MSDPVQNFFSAQVYTNVTAADTFIELDLEEAATAAAMFAEGEYNLVFWNGGDYDHAVHDPDVEIVRVVGVSGRMLQIQRPGPSNNYNGEGSRNMARPHNSPDARYYVSNTVTKRTIEDIVDRIEDDAATVYQQLDSDLAYVPFTVSRDAEGLVATQVYTMPTGTILKTINRDAEGFATSYVFTGNLPGGLTSLTATMVRNGDCFIDEVTYSQT